LKAKGVIEMTKKSNSPLILPSEITPQHFFENRRNLMKVAAASTLTASMGDWFSRNAFAQSATNKLNSTPNMAFSVNEKKTSYEDVTSYNNFYEFGMDKSDPKQNAKNFQTTPWKVSIEGLVNKPKVFDLADLLKLAPMEERIYRMRWSMVIPWVGYSLSNLIKQVEPQGSAKFVEFISLADKKQMPGIGSEVISWPYVEGLRLDEAMHPLTLLTLGLYGEVLPKQNGAPVRLVVPWKYGFKSAKSIIKIRLVEKQPANSWWLANPGEYGFYSNVNPEVDHPRWSQASERRIGDDKGFFGPKRKTLMHNGYAEQVGSMYAGMDLKKYY
jgi:methionine sulfoxide reductase catalytic subunit